MRSREIIEIISDVVRQTSKDCTLTMYGGEEIECPPIKYVFGNSQYVKDSLDTLSKTPEEDLLKFPLIVLFCPFNEQRNMADYHSKAKVRVLIACATSRDWSNEERLHLSFRNILRPIYERFLESLKEDGRFDFGYEEVVAHEYSENYSYGRYGAYTQNGEEVSEPIDAIVLSNLELKVKNPNCRE